MKTCKHSHSLESVRSWLRIPADTKVGGWSSLVDKMAEYFHRASTLPPIYSSSSQDELSLRTMYILEQQLSQCMVQEQQLYKVSTCLAWTAYVLDTFDPRLVQSANLGPVNRRPGSYVCRAVFLDVELPSHWVCVVLALCDVCIHLTYCSSCAPWHNGFLKFAFSSVGQLKFLPYRLKMSHSVKYFYASMRS